MPDTQDPNVALSVESSSTADTPSSVPTASPENAASPNAASSAEPPVLTVAMPLPDPANDPSLQQERPMSQTFEQRVEARFLDIEKALLNLPHAIAQANGHPEPASWCARVHNFLFGKNEEPQA